MGERLYDNKDMAELKNIVYATIRGYLENTKSSESSFISEK